MTILMCNLLRKYLKSTRPDTFVMKRVIALTFFLLALSFLHAQKFPDAYVGYWRGDLNIYKGDSVVQTIRFGLDVLPADSGRYDWIITYYPKRTKNDTADPIDYRPYTLLPIDTTKGHWAIDEGNGIVIDMWVTGNKVTSLFSVMGSMIQISYWREGDELMMELFSYPEKEDSKSGKGTEESPEVKAWKFTGYQMGRMKLQKGMK